MPCACTDAEQTPRRPGRMHPRRKAPTPDAELQRPSADAAPAQATRSQAALMAPGPADVAGSIPAVREVGAVTEFAARWPSPLDARYLDRAEIGTTDSMDTGLHTTAAAAETTVNLPVVTAARGGREGQRASRQEVLQTASLAGGAALALLFFAGWIVKAGGRSRLQLGAELATIDGHAWAPASLTGGPAARLPTPTDPAVDLKRSLGELMRDLRRADATTATNKPPECKAPAAPDGGHSRAGARARASRSDRAALRRTAPAAASDGCS